MKTNSPPYSRDKRDVVISLAFVRMLEDIREKYPALFDTIISPLLEALEESQDEIIGLGREYMELLESLSVKH